MSFGANRMAGRSTGRVLRTELLRGTAPVAALALAVTGVVLLFTDPMPWAGRWGPLAEHLRVTRQTIETCRCRDGCPSCVQSPKCGNGNDPLDKAGAVRVLELLLARAPDTSR
jgi:hypothetical protein